MASTASASAPQLPRVNADVLDGARMVAVVDTNYFIDHLPLLRSLSELGLELGLVLVVPWVVIQELDGLKSSSRVTNTSGSQTVAIASLARSATRFLDDELGQSGSALRCQKKSEYLVDEIEGDDKILDCCLYFLNKKGLPVAILTKDRNLTVKARANGCATCGEWSGSATGLISAVARSIGVSLLKDEQKRNIDGQNSTESIAPEFGRTQSDLANQTVSTHAEDDDCMDVDMAIDSDYVQQPSNAFAFTASAPVHPPLSASPNTSSFAFNGSQVGATTPLSPQFPASSAATPPKTAATTPLARGSGVMGVLPPRKKVRPYTNSPQNLASGDKPVLIYLDEFTAKEKAVNQQLSEKPAHLISREITHYMCHNTHCALTKLISERLEKELRIGYGTSNANASERQMFAKPPWKSCTTLLTVILYYWDIFQRVFPKGVNEAIRATMPWVMHVEHLTACPQTQSSLPPHLRIEPYQYAFESDNVFENARNQAAERNAETAKLIILAKRLLAQCALVENEAQENLREETIQKWVIWQKIHSQPGG
ncbi:hypothetical protein H4R20_002596 [Coemansia guatemalensis]|uniref:PIN domain-containing protein n=1 Tax=Coemansia guatemalensis TaxID=2761395 RepID=A0A9W8I273_9FUNG|nr:hypothetical protein H4R20_002596 [Coemansia guatemalensis]